ncbi:TetR/AcrR family transcriptional regulator [Metabacillus niabensis]|uniref:AcrR family transcriptional regulator n=1 Tax=Metabacillus niabensis TaxID=324854 RepID=A0ABT9YWL5_9BACI|nr:TetR/AcrR family transcriptional regulator [Metabacillus niabensis]MDQ0224384.1 AcrR family transcriptional regulator [Metabacillus niabensis]
MSEQTELQRMDILRLSNEESNKVTRECIETALIQLMNHKKFKDISITDIVNRAGVSRTAYYRNYSSKEDILTTHLETVVKTITTVMESHGTEDNFKFWHTLFSQVRIYADIYLVLLKADFGGVILTSINKIVRERIPVDFMTREKKYDILFWCGAVYNILTDWLTSDMEESEEEMADICCKVIKEINEPW